MIEEGRFQIYQCLKAKEPVLLNLQSPISNLQSSVRLVLLVEAGTHLICDALISPYKMGERVRVRKLLRSVDSQMLLMWDRGLHSFKMVKSVLDKKCHFLGRMPKNVKFEVVKTLSDGSYISWIAPDRKSKKKGAKRIPVRIIEYVIEEKGQRIADCRGQIVD